MVTGATAQHNQSERLFVSLAEHMKLPLLQISHQAELATLQTSRQTAPEVLTQIHSNAQVALRLIDAYTLSIKLAAQESYTKNLQPVAVSSVLYEAAHELSPIAKLYDVELELSVDGRYGPITANQEGLTMALVSLGYALIEALPATGAPQLRLQLAAHHCRYGLVAGLYADVESLTAESLRLGRRLSKTGARQPLPTLSHGGGTGVFVADAILRALGSHLRVSHHHKRAGLGTVWQPNPQLQLV